MKKLNFDAGVEEYRLQGGGVLRFNPGDPNLYGRCLDAEGQMKKIEESLQKKAESTQQSATGVLELTREADRQLKKLLEQVFPGNDFHKALNGVNLLAVAGNGKPVAVNLFAALEEILTAGAEAFADAQVQGLRQA